MLQIRTRIMSCPSDSAPHLNTPRSVWVDIPDVAEKDIKFIVNATNNYVGVNSVHASTCYVHQRRPGLVTIPEGNNGFFSALNEHRKHKDLLDGHSNILAFGERAWEYRTRGQTYNAYAANTYTGRFAKQIVTVNGQGDGDACGTLNNGEAINFPHAEPLKAMDTFSSRHPGGALFSMADGSVHFLSDTTDPNTLVRLGHISDGEFVGDFQN